MGTDTSLPTPSAAATDPRAFAADRTARRRPSPPTRGTGCRARGGNQRVNAARRRTNRIAMGALGCLGIALTACGGGSHLSVEASAGEEVKSYELVFLPEQPVEHRLPLRVSGGIRPYESTIEGCPGWVTLFPDQRILAGTAPVAASGQTFFCTYHVSEAQPGFRPARTVSRGLRLLVRPSPAPPELSLPPPEGIAISVGAYHGAALPEASGGVAPYTYSLSCANGSLPPGMGFAPETRVLAGTPQARFRDSCTFTVIDSAQPAATVSRAFEVVVAGPLAGPLRLPPSVVPGNVLRLRVNERARVTFREASGGVPPYTYELQCPNPPPIGSSPASSLPAGLGFGPLTRVLSGTPGTPFPGPDCTYSVTDSASPPATEAQSVALIVDAARAKWRFTQRSLLQADTELTRESDRGTQQVYRLPEAMPESGGEEGSSPVYRLRGVAPPLTFDASSRRLEYKRPACTPGDRDPNVCDPATGRISTYRYQVLFGDTVDDTLCVHLSFRDEDETDRDDMLIASVRIHDDAWFDGTEYRCPSMPLQTASASRASRSNPVHEALGPVHARRALDVAHGSLRDGVRGWTPGAPRVLTAIAPKIGIGSLSGQSDGFDYTGSSESVSTGAEIGSGSWQAGVVGSFTRTELHYRAAERLVERGYRSGEHTTEILSLHPFAAWHLPSGGHVWTSLGAGTGELRHRDELGFPSWSRSDVRLRAYSAGASVPIADFLSGELEAQAGVEGFAFEIEGGDRISSALPTLRGRDWRTGLAWSAPVAGAPSVSMAYRQLTGDGPEGGQLEAKASMSARGIFDPRLALTGHAEGSVGLGENEHSSWGLSSGIRFASGQSRRGFGLKLDTRLDSLENGEPPGVGLRGEAGYGVWTGYPLGTVRPYIGLVRHPAGNYPERIIGADVRHAPDSHAKLEFQDRQSSRALRFSLGHRF